MWVPAWRPKAVPAEILDPAVDGLKGMLTMAMRFADPSLRLILKTRRWCVGSSVGVGVGRRVASEEEEDPFPHGDAAGDEGRGIPIILSMCVLAMGAPVLVSEEASDSLMMFCPA